MKKCQIEIGYTKSGNIHEDYKYWSRQYLIGIDTTLIDGIGNKIIIGVREHGTRIELNGKVIKDIECKPEDAGKL